MQTCAIVSQTKEGGPHTVSGTKVFRTQMFSRSYEFRSAAVLEGSKTIGRQVNRTSGIKGGSKFGLFEARGAHSM